MYVLYLVNYWVCHFHIAPPISSSHSLNNIDDIRVVSYPISTAPSPSEAPGGDIKLGPDSGEVRERWLSELGAPCSHPLSASCSCSASWPGARPGPSCTGSMSICHATNTISHHHTAGWITRLILTMVNKGSRINSWKSHRERDFVSISSNLREWEINTNAVKLIIFVLVGLDIPDYVTDDDRPKHVQDIIKRLKEKHYL